MRPGDFLLLLLLLLCGNHTMRCTNNTPHRLRCSENRDEGLGFKGTFFFFYYKKVLLSHYYKVYTHVNRPANAQFWPANCKVHSKFKITDGIYLINLGLR